MTATCPECGAAAEVNLNPARYLLPKFRGSCRGCGHEWDFNPSPRDDRMVD